MATYRHLLRSNPNFTRLWIAQAISLLGDWFDTIALSTLVSKYSDESGLAISLFLLCRFLPPLVVGPLAGVLLDRFNRKRFLILSDVARVFIVLGFLLADSPGKLWLIYLFTILQFAISAFFEPGRSALLPSILQQDMLVQANMLGSVTWSVMSAVGGALGGLVAGVFGTATALIIDSFTFAVSAVLISQVKPRELISQGGPATPSTVALRTDFMDSLRYVRQHPAIATTLLVKAGSTVGSMDTLMIIYATSLFVIGDKGAGSLGILWAAFGVGAILGPVVFEQFNDGSIPTMRRFILFGFGFITVGWVIFAGAPALAVVALAMVVKAMGGTNWTYSTVILQRLTADRYLGRVFSLDLMGFQVSLVISIIVTGFLVDVIGPAHVRSIVLGTALISLMPLVLWSRAVQWFEQHAYMGYETDRTPG
jgi:MFS family permease